MERRKELLLLEVRKTEKLTFRRRVTVTDLTDNGGARFVDVQGAARTVYEGSTTGFAVYIFSIVESNYEEDEDVEPYSRAFATYTCMGCE